MGSGDVRQREVELRAKPRRTLGPDVPLARLDNAPRNREAKPDSTTVSSRPLPELTEDMS